MSDVITVAGIEAPWTVTRESITNSEKCEYKAVLTLHRDRQPLHSVVTRYLHETDAAGDALREFVTTFELARSIRLGQLAAEYDFNIRPQVEEEIDTMTEPRFPDAHVTLTGDDGNAFAIMQRVKEAIRSHLRETENATWTEVKPLWEQYFSEATAGDYNHLLSVTMKWVTVA